MNITTNIIAVQALPGVGPKTTRSLAYFMAQASGERDFIKRVLDKQSTNRRLARLTPDIIRRAYVDALQIVRESETHGIAINTILDPSYPSRLKALEDAPCVLFSYGELGALHQNQIVNIVGTRKPSAFGRHQSARIASYFAERGIPVVSGLAIGCDIAAHRACNSLHTPSIAVLAHGLDKMHPTTHRKDAEQILESGGCWVSEYPVGTALRPHQLAARNRLQIGLSDALIVVETKIEGGTMLTAQLAARQGKLIATIAHPVSESQIDQAQGNQLLIAKGALVLQAEGCLDLVFKHASQQGQMF